MTIRTSWVDNGADPRYHRAIERLELPGNGKEAVPVHLLLEFLPGGRSEFTIGIVEVIPNLKVEFCSFEAGRS